MRRTKGRVDALGGAAPPGPQAAQPTLSASGAQGARGPALGIFSQAEYANNSCEVEAGDVVLLFTDGLFEVENARGELFSESGLRAAIARFAQLAPEALIRAAVEEAEKFASGRPFPDDMCVVAVEITRLEPAEEGAAVPLGRGRGNGRRNGVSGVSGVSGVKGGNGVGRL